MRCLKNKRLKVDPKPIINEYRHIILLVLMGLLAVYVYLGEIPSLDKATSKNIAMALCLVICVVYFLVYVQFKQPPPPRQVKQEEQPVRQRDVFGGIGDDGHT